MPGGKQPSSIIQSKKKMPRYKIYQGDVLEKLAEMPTESVHCVVTSPPYWWLRDYGAGAQIGLEETPEAYVGKLVSVFSEVKRVLRKDGTLWLNLGDSYGGSGKGPDAMQPVRDYISPPYTGNGIKAKDLVGIPWMVAFALRADGWYLRSDIIWSKPNPMPESVTDRPTKSHEYIFLLSKSPRYYFDAEAVRENSDPKHQSRYRSQFNTGFKETHNGRPGGAKNTAGFKSYNGKRNIRSVWVLATQPFKGAHFATFPTKLVDRCIRAGTSSEGVCQQCGASWTRNVERESTRSDVRATTEKGKARENGQGFYRPNSQETGGVAGIVTTTTTGWRPSCLHDAGVVPAVVLDPFSGSGTTGVSANALGRDYIGIELNPEYVAMSENRLFNPQPSFMDLMRDKDGIHD